MTMTLTILPEWNEVTGTYAGHIVGMDEIGPVEGGTNRLAFEAAVAARLATFDPPCRDFTVVWPDKPAEFHLAA